MYIYLRRRRTQEERMNWSDWTGKHYLTSSSSWPGEMRRVGRKGFEILYSCVHDTLPTKQCSNWQFSRFTVIVRGEELSVGTKLGFTKWGLTKVNISSFKVSI